MNKYKIIENTIVTGLQQDVMHLLDMGWKLHGPLIVTVDTTGLSWYRQVVVQGPNT